VKNAGSCFKNGDKPTPRVEFIMSLCDEMGLEFELDQFENERNPHARDLSKEYGIRDLAEISDFIPDDKMDQVWKLYTEFEDKMEVLYRKRKGFDEMDKLELEYDKKLKELVGEIQPKKLYYFNIILKGTSDKFVVAHHDIVNPASDNANDNSCSVINALMIKKLRPEVNVVILDGEEFGGFGSTHLSKRIKNGDFNCKWILNLELTGKGGKSFFVGAMGTPLTDWIANRFECPIVKVPFNDSVIFKKYGIDSTVINPLPITDKKGPVINKDDEYLDFSMLFNCHKMADSVDTIDPNDMEEFVNEVCLKIIDEA
jgi:acyl carrier protein